MGSNKKIIESVNDEFEQKNKINGIVIASIIAIFTCVAMMILEFINCRTIDYGKPCIVAAISSVSSLFEGFKNAKIKEIIYGIVCLLCGIVCFYFYLSKNLGML